VGVGLVTLVALASLADGTPRAPSKAAPVPGVGWGFTNPTGFALPGAIPLRDSACRTGFLTFFPFPLIAQRACLASIRFARAPLFLVGDAGTYDFPADAFDLVFSQFGVMFFADAVAAFGNIRGALRPGGRLAFACWRAMPENAWFREPIQAVRPFVPPLPKIAPDEPGPFSLADPERVRAVLTAAVKGFEIHAHTIDRCTPRINNATG